MAYRVSKEHFGTLVERALRELPRRFAEFLEEVPLEIRDRATSDEMASVRLARGALLLGLYRGRPLTQRSVLDSATFPDVIYIFQQAIEEVCTSEESLVRQVRTTVLHEIGHHFGMNEDDLDKLGYG